MCENLGDTVFLNNHFNPLNSLPHKSMPFRACLRLAVLIPLLLLGLRSSAAAQSQDCTNPPVIAPGTYSGFVQTNSGFYSIVVPGGHMLSMIETQESGDCVYVLSDVGCVSTLASDYNSGLNRISWVNAGAIATTVVLRALPFSPTSYTFEFGVHPYPCTADPYEDNESCLTAASLTAGSYEDMTVSAVDPDFFTVTVPDGMSLSLSETYDSTGEVDWRISAIGCSALLFGLPDSDSLYWTNSTGAPVEVKLLASLQGVGTVGCSYYDFWLTVRPELCQLGLDDGFENNDDCSTATPIADGAYRNLVLMGLDKDHFAIHVRAGESISVRSEGHNGSTGNLNLYLRNPASPYCGQGGGMSGGLLASGATGSSWEDISWTNNTGADMDVDLEVRLHSQFSFHCTAYDLFVTGSGAADSAGSVFCSPMEPNSTGAPTRLAGTWWMGAGSGLHLEVTSGPPGNIGYFLICDSPYETGVAISEGRLCFLPSASVFGRYNVAGSQMNSVGLFDASGVLQNVVGTSSQGSGFDVPNSIPPSGLPQIPAGSTWYFQVWHREAAGASNFSNGLSVTF